MHVKNATALSDYLQRKKVKQEKIIPEDKTPLVSDSEEKNSEAAPLDRQPLMKPKAREHDGLE